MADSAAHLVDEVLPEKPIRQWVLSVPFQLRFLFATQPQVMSKVLAIVHRVISTFLIKRAGLTVKSGAQTGAVFYPVKSPTSQDLEKVAQKIAERLSRYLEKAGYLVRDAEADYLDLYTDEEDAMAGRPRRALLVLLFVTD